mgnify:FL=1
MSVKACEGSNLTKRVTMNHDETDKQILINEYLIEITQNIDAAFGQITENFKILDAVNQSFDRRLSLLQEQLETITKRSNNGTNI